MLSTVIIMGSSLDGQRGANWAKPLNSCIVAIDSAYTLRNDWDYAVFSDDYDHCLRPQRPFALGQKTVTSKDYTPSQNALGGFIYGGAHPVFTSGYWALRTLRPRVIAYYGCDQIFNAPSKSGPAMRDGAETNFTIRHVGAKSARLMLLAAMAGCAVVNLSMPNNSPFVFPHKKLSNLTHVHHTPIDYSHALLALRAETECDYYVPSGRYHEIADQIDLSKLDQIDRHWLMAAGLSDQIDPCAA